MGREGREGGRGREGRRDACYTYSNRYVHSLSPRHVERNYVSRRSIVSRRTRVRNYVRRDVDILRHPDSLTNKLPELVYKLVLSTDSSINSSLKSVHDIYNSCQG